VPRPSVTPGVLTTPQIQEGGTVTIGQSSILRFGIDKIPIKVSFDSAGFTVAHKYHKAESGYKLLVLQLTVQNIGNKEVNTFSWLDKWEVIVDRGYVYEPISRPSLDVKPEEKKTEYVVFEILQDTTPVEVKYYRFLSLSPSLILNLRGFSFATETPLLQRENVIRLGQPFTLKSGYDDIPVEITFTSAWFAMKHDYYKADAGYKLLVLTIQVKNVGMKETKTHCIGKLELIVDKGYLYREKHCNLTCRSLRPEEVKTGYVLFEILATTNPTEILYYASMFLDKPTLILDLHNQSIPTRTAAAKVDTSISSCSWPMKCTSITNYKPSYILKLSSPFTVTTEGGHLISGKSH